MSLLKRIERGSGQAEVREAKSAPSPSPIRVKSPESQRRRAPNTAQRDAFKDLKERIQDKLVAELDPAMDISRTDEVRRTIQDMYEQILTQENIILSRSERERLFEGIVAEILGFGPLEILLADESVSEIMVNGPEKVSSPSAKYRLKITSTS